MSSCQPKDDRARPTKKSPAQITVKKARRARALRNVMLNGVDAIALTKLDVLDDLDEIPVCVAYEVNGKRHRFMPYHQSDLHDAVPVYEELKGWNTSLTDVTDSARAREELTARATFDVLTGCHNRASTMAVLQRAVAGLNGQSLEGRTLTVNEARPQRTGYSGQRGGGGRDRSGGRRDY